MISNKHREKLLNAILYFSGKVKYPTLVKIFKLLFFLDFSHFKETGRSVTNLVYYAWPYGPVPRELFFAIRDESSRPEDFRTSLNFIKQQTQKVEESIIFKPKATPNLKIFTPRERRLMDILIEIYQDTTPAQMSEITHLKNSPWDKTRKEIGENEEISYDRAIDRDSPLSIEEGKEAYKEFLEEIENYSSKPL
ncbi:Panacea domain-containing protein [Leptospira adleri]|uniref:Panacea domain-containing protein n=1 Tax=Leptospira adleri TaxID=2023186 RepID=UPI001084548B|nr:Panacea domain-containing protein [Leptospira adleri]TGM58674.1 DUF4065 domain-containing protein [Leptospira adleri]